MNCAAIERCNVQRVRIHCRFKQIFCAIYLYVSESNAHRTSYNHAQRLTIERRTDSECER